jgi:hypothetical protein
MQWVGFLDVSILQGMSLKKSSNGGVQGRIAERIPCAFMLHLQDLHELFDSHSLL